MSLASPWEVVSYKEQLESKGLLTPEWKTDKVFPHCTRVRQSFKDLAPALALYNTLRATKGVAAMKNWVG